MNHVLNKVAVCFIRYNGSFIFQKALFSLIAIEDSYINKKCDLCIKAMNDVSE